MGRWQVWSARREERRVLLEDGRRLAPPDPKLAAFDASLEESLRRDREDYARVSPWARWLVILRGLFDRAVLRALRREAQRERDEACIALAAATPSEVVPQARAAREQAEKAAWPMPLPMREAAHFGGFLAK